MPCVVRKKPRSEMMSFRDVIKKSKREPSLLLNKSVEVAAQKCIANYEALKVELKPTREDFTKAFVLYDTACLETMKTGDAFFSTFLFMLQRDSELLEDVAPCVTTRCKVFHHVVLEEFKLNTKSEVEFLKNSVVPDLPEEWLQEIELEFYKMLCRIKHAAFIESTNWYLEQKETNETLVGELSELKKRKFVKTQIVEKEIQCEEDKKKIDELSDEIISLQYQLDTLKAACTDRGMASTVEEAEERLLTVEKPCVDLSKYKILVLTSDNHNNCFDYECIDLDRNPKLLARIKNFDALVIDTKHISHPSYWMARNEAKHNGVKCVHYGRRDKQLLNNLLGKVLEG